MGGKMFCSIGGKEKYRDHFESGTYVCVKCDHPLFSAMPKFNHDSAWPAFTEALRVDSVTKVVETEKQESSDKPSLKLFCGKCGNGIGHEFLRDGPNESSRF